nr:uncharacterized protein CTRU02_01254 [Colletotrichum truncatum]KAF6800849.1 secreted protein [Colletotrichum truncatum]
MMDTTQQRHTPSSIAEQELFFTSGSQAHGRHEHEYDQQAQNRWYDDLNDDSPIVPTRSDVPAVNIIPATPTTVRSNSVRSQFSFKDPNEQKHITGPLPEVEEEDNIYDPPENPPNNKIHDSPTTKSHSPPPIESKAPAEEMASSSQPPYQSTHPNDYYSPPTPEPAIPHHDTGYEYPHPQPQAQSQTQPQPQSQPNEHHMSDDKGKSPEPPLQHHDVGHGYSEPVMNDTPYDKGKSHESPVAGAEEERPPLPGPRPSNPEITDYYAQSHAADPAIQEQEDRDYAMALALQEEEEGERPPLPQRPSKSSYGLDHKDPLSSHPVSTEDEDRALAMRLQQEEEEGGGSVPPLPTRPHPDAVAAMLAHQQQQQEPPPFTRTPSTEGLMAPPKRQGTDFGGDDPNNPVHYSRDPQKLIAYLVPFPKPWLGARAPTDAIPTRFLIYTPPPPPLQAPPEGVKEGVTHKVQRKWQNEVRQAKQSDAKTTSWAGFKAKCTRGVDKAMQYTTTSNLDFLARVTPPPSASSSSNLASKLSIKGIGKKGKSNENKEETAKGKGSAGVDEHASEIKLNDEEATPADEKAREAGLDEKAREENPFEEKFSEDRVRDEKVHHDEKGDRSPDDVKEHDVFQDDDPAHQSHETKKTVGVEEIVFVYPPTMNMTPEAMREEFINTMLRTKSKAQRDAIIATGLLPVSLAIDLVMIAVSGLFEVNAVWAYFTIKGTKTARSVTKRIASKSQKPETIDPQKSEKEMEKEDKLKLTFKPAPRTDILTRYLEAECHRVDSRLFPRYTTAPTEV